MNSFYNNICPRCQSMLTHYGKIYTEQLPQKLDDKEMLLVDVLKCCNEYCQLTIIEMEPTSKPSPYQLETCPHCFNKTSLVQRPTTEMIAMTKENRIISTVAYYRCDICRAFIGFGIPIPCGSGIPVEFLNFYKANFGE